MAINSREKGKRGERHIAGLFRENGYDVRRGQQFSGANGDADIVGAPGIHAEVKFVQALNISKAMEQAIRDAREGEKPTVFHKKDREPVMVTMLFNDWIELYREWEAGVAIHNMETAKKEETS